MEVGIREGDTNVASAIEGASLPALLRRATELLRAGEIGAAAACVADGRRSYPDSAELDSVARQLAALTSTAPAGPRPFHTDYRYVDRETKPRYVWEKYGAVLEGRILDVGADASQMRDALPADCDYTGIGIGAPPTVPVDFEKQGIPYAADSFDCVLCLDVLEHVDNIHALFDELCRVAKHHVIVSLPNCYNAFWGMIQGGAYRPGRALKFYGLPVEPPPDRHKWFFHIGEAEEFVRHRAELNGMEIVQMDYEGEGQEREWAEAYAALQRAGVVHGDLDPRALFAGPLWALLRVRG